MSFSFYRLVAFALLLASLVHFGSEATGAAVAISSGLEGGSANWAPRERESGIGVIGGMDRTWWNGAGQSWFLGDGGRWTRLPEMDLPVPVDEVRFISEAVLITITGEVWHTLGEGWMKAEPFPG